MNTQQICINGIPAILWGVSSKRLYLYIHGQDGNKEEAATLSEIVCRQGWQVLSIDLPEHGDRKGEMYPFVPWHIVPELNSVMEYVKSRWKHISLFANSIGAWFSMLSFCNERLEKCLFVSPVLDMEQLISKMMRWENVSEVRLKQELIIPTSFGQTLSWEYWRYAIEHPIVKWDVPTKILYGGKDNLIERGEVELFTRKFGCDLTVMENGEHWFHTEHQVAFMRRWLNKSFRNKELSGNER